MLQVTWFYGARCLTGKNSGKEELGNWRRVLLDIALVVVEGTFIATGK
jgi:hypothetical protein